MFIENILTITREHLKTIKEDAPLKDAALMLCDTPVSLVVVCNPGGIMSGVVTKSDIVRQMGSCQGASCHIPATAVMTRSVISCRPNELLQDVWSLMKDRGFIQLPVIDEEARPLGVLRARDALIALLDEVEYEESLLRDYVTGIGYR